MPIDHVALFVQSSSFDSILTWYDAALAPLGYKRMDFIPGALIGMSAESKSYDFWIHKKDDTPRTPTHFAFKAESKEAVDAFHKVGVEAGGKSNGEPGLRPIYHEKYYAAYVVDPCG